MRETTVHGIPVTVLDDADMDRERESQRKTVFALTRVTDIDFTKAQPGFKDRALKTPCERCSQICYYDPLVYDKTGGLNIEIVCIPCLYAEAHAKQQQ